MFTLFKWFLWLALPSTLVLLGLLLTIFWLLFRKQFRPAMVLLLLEAMLVIPMTPAVSTAVGWTLEKRYPPKALTEIPKADAIVVLGGGLGSVQEGVPYPECYAASDRVVMAFRLWRAGKAPIVIPTGEMANISEKPMLETFGMPSSSIICEEKARDTAENATKTFALLAERNCKKVLVVTSSWHLTRTMMLFNSPDIEFIPVSCDTEATLSRALAAKAPLWQKLPSFQAGMQTMIYAKEWLGILFYSFRKPKLTTATPKSAPKKS